MCSHSNKYCCLQIRLWVVGCGLWVMGFVQMPFEYKFITLECNYHVYIDLHVILKCMCVISKINYFKQQIFHMFIGSYRVQYRV